MPIIVIPTIIKLLYSNVDNFMAEIEKTDNILKDIIGDSYRAKYMRMPGGGFGEKYEPFKSVLLKRVIII